MSTSERLAAAVAAHAQAVADKASRAAGAERDITITLDIVDGFARAEPVVSWAAFAPAGLYRTNDADADGEVWTFRPRDGGDAEWATSAVIAARMVRRLGPQRAVGRVSEYLDDVLRVINAAIKDEVNS